MADRPIRVLAMASSMHAGGSERQTATLLTHLDRGRFEPSLALTHRDGVLIGSLPADVSVHAPPAEVLRRRRWDLPGAATSRHAAWLADIVRKQQIDVIYDRSFHMTLIAGDRRLGGVPRVSTIVSPPEVAVPTVERRFVAIKRRRLADAYRRSATVVAVSRAASDSARRYYHLNRPVDVIANPFAPRQRPMPPPPDWASDRDGYVHLVCVGRLSIEKGQQDLLDALPDVRFDRVWLHIIGDGPMRSDLQRRWQADSSSKCPHRVTFEGVVSDPASHVASADALVLPSRFEGMPNVVLEAFAAGTPVVATTAGGTAELLGDPLRPCFYPALARDSWLLAAAVDEFLADRAGGGVAARAAAATERLAAEHDLAAAIERISGHLIASVRR